MYSVYVGTIEKVFSPSHPFNTSKFQYEYSVLVNTELFSQTSIICIKADSFGGFDDFEDAILSPGNLVLVSFARDDFQSGAIIGCARQFSKKTEVSRGVHWRKRFNKFEMGIDSSYNWYAKSDSGPNAHVMVDKIILNDSAGQTITLDKNSKTITINAELWTININKDVKMTVGGNMTATISGNATVKVGGKLDATVGGKATIKAASIALNGEGGRVLTDKLNPVIDYITGVPSIGVPTVTSGD